MNNDEKMDLILRSHQILLREVSFRTGDNDEKAVAIDEAITELLNPKINPGVAERTHHALSEDKK